MWKLAAIALTMASLAAVSLVMSGPVNAQVDPYLKQKQEQMLYPTVLVEAAGSIGAGVVIYSDKRSDGKYDTYIMTNKHVIEGALEGGLPVDVGFTEYDSDFRVTGTLSKFADIIGVGSTPQDDIAILRLHDHERQMPFVAHIAPADVKVEVLERVWTIGSTLGQPPFPSEGVVAGKDFYSVKGTRYVRTSMFAQHGSSGGGLFHYDAMRGYELIGIVTAIYVGSAAVKTGEPDKKPEDKPTSSGVIEQGNLSYSLPIEVVRSFLTQSSIALGVKLLK